MSNITDILDFRFSQNSFAETGRNIVSSNILKLCQSRISTLNDIAEKIGKSMIDEKPTRGIREVYFKFINISQSTKDFNDTFDKRELRTLTYALTFKENQQDSIFENPNYLKLCFSLLEENWRDAFISGLLDCYLSNWGSAKKDSFNILSNFLTSKIEKYKGSRNLFQSLKTNSKFFDKDKGDLDLGATMAISNKSISEATKYLSLPDHWITYPYFSGVINGYFEKSKNQLDTTLDDIAHVLEKHSNSIKATKTNKIIVSKIICHTTTANESIQNNVKDVAFQLVGDPGITSIWRPYENASQDEISTINKARTILNEWVTREFINVFFEKCIPDKRRKEFWLKYSNQISFFKVYGPVTTQRILKNDKRVSEYVEARYSQTWSSKNVSAFIIYIKNHTLIEFSQDGYAFIAYRNDSSRLPDLNSKINSVDDLRDGYFQMAVTRKYEDIESENYEGRLFHKDGTFRSGSILKWEDVFEFWLKKYVL